LDPRELDILSHGPTADGMINQQTIFIYFLFIMKVVYL